MKDSWECAQSILNSLELHVPHRMENNALSQVACTRVVDTHNTVCERVGSILIDLMIRCLRFCTHLHVCEMIRAGIAH